MNAQVRAELEPYVQAALAGLLVSDAIKVAASKAPVVLASSDEVLAKKAWDIAEAARKEGHRRTK